MPRTKSQVTRERVVTLELEARNAKTYHKRVETATRAGVDQAHALFVDSYHDLGAKTTPVDRSRGEVGTRFLSLLKEELESLPSIVIDLMSYASLVTCEGATNALSREGYRHFEAFDQGNEDFDREVLQVEDAILKQPAGALYDHLWGLHGHAVVRERASCVLAQVKAFSLVGGENTV